MPPRSPPASGSVGLSAPVAALKGVGPKLQQHLADLGIQQVADVLFHLPRAYQDRTRITPITDLRPAQNAVVEGQVALAQIKFGRRRSLIVQITDGCGTLWLRFFYFTRQQQAQFQALPRIRCYGETRQGAYGLELVHPEYRVINESGILPVPETLTPVYPATENLPQNVLRKLAQQALQILQHDPASAPLCAEWLPPSQLQALHWSSLRDAVIFLHQPPPDTALQTLERGRHPAQQRLVVDELIAQQLALQQRRAALRSRRAPKLASADPLAGQLLAALPFARTRAQIRVGNEIARDLQQSVPMLRLLQGDVGSGKTLVATLAALQAVSSGYQATFMAPTELLAEQHFRTLSQWLAPLTVNIVLLTGRLTKRARAVALAAVQSNQAQIIIGTHALFQSGVEFAKLGLLIIDEQHRFGVEQRLALTAKAAAENYLPHQLIMTATPIPRTLAMSLYADLDVSTLDKMPAGRLPINTLVMAESKRADIIARLREALLAGRQAYWVCTLIEESEQLRAQTATETAAALTAALADCRVGLVHGRLKEKERDAVMREFISGKIHLLVATTVIEVGVDVANASVMVIENAERLGLAQLHQLRGRVGRGNTQSDCILLYQSPLGEMARERLRCLRQTTDGFQIAARDLELRGPGEMLGTQQSGLANLRVADLARDVDLLPQAQQLAVWLAAHAPQHISAVLRRWLPNAVHYANA